MIYAKSQNPAPAVEPAKEEEKNSFISEGYVSISKGGHAVPIRILRDTGAVQSLLVEGILPLSEATATGTHVLIQGIKLGIVSVPMHTIYLNCDLVSREVVMGLRPTLPMEGVSLILGNDLAGERVMPDLQVVTEQEVMKVDGDAEATSHIFPACTVTRAMAKEMNKTESEDLLVDLADTLMSHCKGENVTESMSHHTPPKDEETDLVISKRDKLIEEQMNDPEVARLAQEAVDGDNELGVTPECFFKQSGVLMRKWRPRDIPATDT